MSETGSEVTGLGKGKKRRAPLVVVDTEKLTREEWLEYRKKGIGGSDAGAILGISPFRTARDVYYDKLGIETVAGDEENWVAMEMGNLLEGLVARIFQHKTGFEVYRVPRMFRHPIYPFMLADVDAFVRLPDGSIAILEIKTTNYNARANWYKDGEESVPAYYEAQGRHYMAVMDIDRVFFCCLYGNNEDEVLIREIRRDEAYEKEMIFLEQNFWTEHVLKHVPPPYLEDGDVIMDSFRKYCRVAEKDAPEISLGKGMEERLMQYLKLQEEISSSETQSKKLKAEMERLKAILVTGMEGSSKAVCEKNGINYTLTYNISRKATVNKDNLLRLQLLHPDIYKEFVTVSESRRFSVKANAAGAAA